MALRNTGLRIITMNWGIATNPRAPPNKKILPSCWIARSIFRWKLINTDNISSSWRRRGPNCKVWVKANTSSQTTKRIPLGLRPGTMGELTISKSGKTTSVATECTTIPSRNWWASCLWFMSLLLNTSPKSKKGPKSLTTNMLSMSPCRKPRHCKPCSLRKRKSTLSTWCGKIRGWRGRCNLQSISNRHMHRFQKSPPNQ